MTTARVVSFCRVCAEPREITVPAAGFMAWQRGEFIQDAMPEVSAEDREQLISQTCPTCWDEMFPEDFDE